MLVAAEAAGSGAALNLTAIAVAAIGAFGGVLSFLQSRSVRQAQTKLDNRKVDAEAYERAREMDREVVEALREEIERLTSRLVDERNSNADLQERLDSLSDFQSQIFELKQELENERIVSSRLRNQVAALEAEVLSLRQQLDGEVIEALDEASDDDGEFQL